MPLETGTIHDTHFFGRDGAMTHSGDLVLETEAWREKLFAMREEPRRSPYPAIVTRPAGAVRNFMVPGGMGGGGGGLALNQLLVVMDGIDEPPLMKRVRTRKFNTFLDALYIVPARVGKLRLRLRPPKPRKEEVYFIGACNVPLRASRPGAHPPGPDGPPHLLPHAHVGGSARHLRPLPGKVAHEEELDTAEGARRAGPDHQRLLAGDDRPGLLAGADLRPLGRAPRVQPHRPASRR